MHLCFRLTLLTLLSRWYKYVPAPAEEVHGPPSLAVLTEARMPQDWGVYLALADQAVGPREHIRAPIVLI